MRILLVLVVSLWSLAAVGADRVLVHASPPQRAVDRELRDLRRAMAGDPGDRQLVLRYARLALEIGQDLQDARYVAYATTALGAWNGALHPPVEVLILRGGIAQNRHRFNEAMAAFRQATAADPRDPRGWLGLAVVQQVLGEPEAAMASCARLLFSAVETALLCQAGALERSGHSRTALELTGRVLEDSSLPTALAVWGQTLRAEIAASVGENAIAEAAFAQARALAPENAYAINALADYLLDRDRPEAVVALLGGDRRNDGMLLRRTLALQMLGDPEADRLAGLLRARYADARSRGDTTPQREEARFLLRVEKNAAAALDVAVANWAVQREPWDARLLLEAAHAAGRPDAARPVMDWIARTGLDQPVVLRAAQAMATGAP
jgi:tetratricopeptide (TPR) repeat protein